MASSNATTPTDAPGAEDVVIGTAEGEPSAVLGGEPDPQPIGKRGTLHRIGEEAGKLKGKATDKAFELASTGKDKASSAIDDLSRVVGDTAGLIDEKVGAQYGDYARRAAGSLSGFAGTLREKEVDQIVDDARDFVRKSPAVAIGAAVVVGFVLARLVKSAGGSSSDQA